MHRDRHQDLFLCKIKRIVCCARVSARAYAKDAAPFGFRVMNVNFYFLKKLNCRCHIKQMSYYMRADKFTVRIFENFVVRNLVLCELFEKH